MPPAVRRPGINEPASIPWVARRGNPALAALIRCVAAVLGALSTATAGALTGTATVATAPMPIAAVANSVTNKIYVSNYIANGQVTMIDGATNSTTAIPVGSYPYGIDVNMVTNKVYVANSGSNTVTVIDGATNSTATIPVGINPTCVAVNPVTNKVYVVNCSINGTITVIDGATDTVTGNIFVGSDPGPAIAIDAANNTIYAIADSIFSGNADSPTVCRIDGTTGDILEALSNRVPEALAVDPVLGNLYVIDKWGDDVVFISPPEHSQIVYDAGVVVGGTVAVNSVTGKAYFTDTGDVLELDGKTLAVSVLPVPADRLGNPSLLYGIAVDPVANMVYAATIRNLGSLTAIDGVTGQATTCAVGTLPSVVVVNPVTHKVYVLNNDAVGSVSILDGIPAASAPTIAGAPQSQTVNTGSTVVFNAAATGRPVPSYQWAHNGVPLSDGSGIMGSTGAELVLSAVSGVNAGTYTYTATNDSGSATSAAATLAVISTPDPGRIINLSTRAFITGSPLYGDDVLIAGFVIGGTGSKTLIARGVGPTLATFGLSGVVDATSLALYDSSTPAGLITLDTAWQTPPSPPSTAPWQGAVTPMDATAADFSQVGAFALPPGSADSALKISLPAGAYTELVTAADSSEGLVLAELYDADPGNSLSQLVNISSRAYLGSGSDVIIAGFSISGSSAETVLIRGSGPALAALGIAGTAINPQVQLYDVNGNLIASNQEWGGDPQVAAIASRVGAFAWTDPNSSDSALLVTLPPGNYTAVMSAPGSGGTGNALVEVYAVP